MIDKLFIIMKIAILGFGTVGRGVAEILLKESTELTSKIEIKKILIREGRQEYYSKLLEELSLSDLLNKNILTTNISDIINDKEISLVVECMGGVNPAFLYVQKCLEIGKNVVM